MAVSLASSTSSGPRLVVRRASRVKWSTIFVVLPCGTSMALAGFKTRNVFERYNIVSEADLAEGVRKLAERSSGA